MASMREIKRRRASIESTEQITKAMKLVATVKLQRAREKAESGKPYSRVMYETAQHILRKCKGMQHRYLVERPGGKTGMILITSNRGLAGGYNSNAIRQVTGSGIPKEEIRLYTVGRKGHDFLKARGYEIALDRSDVINAPLYKDAIELAELVLKDYEAGILSEIWLVYTEFKNTVTHVPKKIRLLPAQEADEAEEDPLPMNFEPDDDAVLDSIIPQYITSLIYGAFLEGVASENGARMAAMDAATDNAEEMIGKLSVEYNRARQGAITQELTEIIAGSNALK
ncbi:MAG: ATP synthase F1 subunit gamma [Lachnospiraceae bacterium]|nr:ATP synthase F1 subunit gamma [Lachnospiraceae bacterium]